LLFLPRVESGRERVVLRDLLPIAAERNWILQLRKWKTLKDSA